MLDQEVLVEMYGSVLHHVLHKQGVHRQRDEYGDYYNELYISFVVMPWMRQNAGVSLAMLSQL